MSGQIFINYRRDDDPGFTALLREHLAEKFAADQLFMDIDSIEPGLDFVRVLEEKVDKCDVFLAVIGPRWLNSRDEAGNRRLDNPTDFVRIEIESCLKLEKRIIPVLVNNADIPRPEHLPESLKPLARRNAVQLTRDRFKADAQGLIKALGKALEEVEANRLVATTAAAVKAKGQEQEEAAKAEEIERQEKEQARLHAIAGLSPEQILKAEELANWDFIKESKSAQDFRDQLARFPKGVTERMARAKLEAILWEELGELPQIEALDGFLTEFPDGTHATEARARLNELRNSESQRRVAELAAWNAVKETTDAKTLQAFLQEWPNSAHAADGRRLLRQTSPPLKGGGRSPRKILRVAAGAAVIGLPVALLTFQAYYAPDTDHVNDAKLARQSQPVYPSESDNNSTTYTGLARQAQSLNPSSPPKTALNTDTGLATQPQPVYPSESDNNSTTYTGLARQAQSLNPSSPPKTALNTDTGLATQPQPVYPSESDNNSTTYTGLARQAQSLNPSSPPKTALNTDTGLARQPQPVYPSESDNNSTTYTGLARQAQSLDPSSPPKTALNTDTGLAKQPQPVYPFESENNSTADSRLTGQAQPVYPSSPPKTAYNVDTGLAQQPQPVDPTSPSKSDYASQPSAGTTSRVDRGRARARRQCRASRNARIEPCPIGKCRSSRGRDQSCRRRKQGHHWDGS